MIRAEPTGRWRGRVLAILIVLAAPVFATSVPEHQAAFVQTEDELHYFGDVDQMAAADTPFAPNSDFVKSANAVEASGGGGSGDAGQALNQLKFHPLTLKFGEHSVGVPYLAKVTVENPTASKVRFDAISGSTVHFHCSFFQQKNIEPGGQTTFDVVFLARSEGVLENTLYIHSSLGKFAYAVSGKGKANAYRLRPVVGARIPLNGTLVSQLSIHNPHPTTLKVTEIYTSGGELYLELPGGGTGGRREADTDVAWEIPPYHTKTVMTARFLGARERNATAYIRIKTGFLLRSEKNTGAPKPPIHDSNPAAPDTQVWAGAMDRLWPYTIVMPFEVEVTAKKGLFSAADILNFGLVLNDGPSKVLDIRVVSTLNRTVEIESIKDGDEESTAVRIAFDGPVLLRTSGDPRKSVSIGRATFWGSGIDQKEPGIQTVYGSLVIQSKGGFHKLTVPYVATVITGTVKAETAETSFYSGHEPPLEQRVSLTNTFPFPLALYNVSLPKAVRGAFNARLLKEPVTIVAGSGEGNIAFILRYNGGLPAPTSSFVRLYTNVSTFDVPLHVFNGKLRVSLYSMEQDQLDFGVLDTGEKRAIHFAVTNENPVPIPLNQVRHALDPYTQLRLVGMEAGNETILHYKHRPKPADWAPGEDLLIPARTFAVFEFSVVGPTERALYQSSLTLQTPYELKPFPVTFQVEEGTLVSIPEKIVFPDAFPGKMSQQRLQVFSTFQRHMPLLRLSTLSHDPRIFFESFGEEDPPPVVKSGQMSYLGRVLFFPIAGCQDDAAGCYVGMPLHTNSGKWFVYGMKLPANLADIDVYLYQQQRAKWRAIEAAGEDVVNSTIVVDTTEVKHFQIPAKGQLVWPRLMRNAAVHFPLTAVGNFSILNLTLQNPSSLPVVVQLLPLTIYPDPELLLELLKGDFPEPLTEKVEYNETLMFTLRDTELFSLPKDSPVPRFRQEVEEMLGGMAIPRFTLSMLLPPGWKVRVRVGFLPKDYELRSSLLLIRNNLTVLEPVTLYGRGARMEMRISNRLPGRRDRPLLIELRSHHLADCSNPKRQTHKTQTSLTVWHPFYMVNTGEVPFTVIGLNISNQACENHGFRILNCENFHLRPNQTREIRIAFTADFTATWTEAHLQIFLWGNASATIFPLAASIPQEWIALCHKALPRHPYEPMFYYFFLILFVLSTIVSVAVAYIEGDRIIATAMQREHYREQNLTRFDLNAAASAPDNAQTGRGRVPDAPRKNSRAKIPPPNSKTQDQQATQSKETPAPPQPSFIQSLLSSLGRVFPAADPPPEGSPTSARTLAAPAPRSPTPVKTKEEPKKDDTPNGLRHRKQQPQPPPPAPCRETELPPTPPAKPSPKPSKPPKKTTESRPPPPPALSALDEQADDSWELVERPKRNITPQSEDGSSAGGGQPAPPLHQGSGDQNIILRRNKTTGRSSGRESSVLGSLGPRESVAPRLSTGSGGSRSEESSETRQRRKAPNPAPTPLPEVKDVNNPYNYVAKVTADVVNHNRLSPTASVTSEESAVPEWDSVSVQNDGDGLNFDEAFKTLSSETERFAGVGTLPGLGLGGLGAVGSRRASEDRLSSSSRSDASSDLEASGSSSPSQVDKIVGVPRAKTRLPVKPRLPKAPRKGLALQTQGAPPVPSFQPTSPVGPPPGFTSPIPGTPLTPDNSSGLSWASPHQVLGQAARAAGAAATRRGPSMMQRLQQERKARLEAYRQERGLIAGEEEWPGLELEPVAESLWDEEHEPWSLFGSNSPSPFPAQAWPPPPPVPATTLGLLPVSGSSTPSLAPLIPGTDGTQGDEGEDKSSSSKRSSSIDQLRLERPKFAWNVAATPFRPIHSASGGESGGDEAATSSSRAHAPPNLEDPSIIGWGPPTSPASSVPQDSSRSSPSALAGSLFAGVSTSIWDPSLGGGAWPTPIAPATEGTGTTGTAATTRKTKRSRAKKSAAAAARRNSPKKKSS